MSLPGLPVPLSPDSPDRPGLPDRKQDEVRRMLAGPYPRVPPDLAARAAERGRRLLARRTLLRRLGWLLALCALVALFVLVTHRPWLPPPTHTTPPVEGW
ncbi:hypothetical protein GCM10012285_20310 [Streptomyces kronopolitis]|uniref:Uncharacterized protein n=1 Tax=Streptomyces kronopolitis TaxID=1612435 RepID=A0ABQ2J6L5_9ACTN|nr:hypothetical protein [Streptomyces kronopolitis]GGN41271.1 hypothetical protein GCM10012285_20310 [Streptomyces kronopolitis]